MLQAEVRAHLRTWPIPVHVVFGDADPVFPFESGERWAAEILESHISYPILCYYRSQHDNQSWLAAMTAIMDCCALILVGIETTSWVSCSSDSMPDGRLTARQ